MERLKINTYFKNNFDSEFSQKYIGFMRVGRHFLVGHLPVYVN